jgi:hypothetical protein
MASPTAETADKSGSGFGFMGETATPTVGSEADSASVSSGFGFMGSESAPAPAVVPNITSAFDGLNSIATNNGDTMNASDGGNTGTGSGGALEAGGEDAVQVNNQLREHEANLELLEQQCAGIQTIVYQFEEMRTQFLNAKSELAQLNGNLERLQAQGIDTIVTQHLNLASQEAVKSERKVLSQRIAFLFDQISVTADYMSKLTVA